MMEFQANRPGIYAILNLPAKRIYIGQASNLKVRAYKHANDLENGKECNLGLQRDYQNPKTKLLDFTLVDGISQDQLCYYESVYIYISRFWENELRENRLYNVSKNNIDLNSLAVIYHKKQNEVKRDIAIAKKNFTYAIQTRFGGKRPSEIVKMKTKELSALEDEYIKKEYGKLRTGEFNKKILLSRPDFNFKLYSLDEEPFCKKINLDYMIFTTIGSYMDQDIYEIFKEKFEDLNSNGYCLWAVNKMNAATVRKFCREQGEKEEKRPIYVMMWYTGSKDKKSKLIDDLGRFKEMDKYDEILEELKENFVQEARKTYNGYESFRAEDIQAIEKENKLELKNLKLEEDYKFPSSLPHIETGKKSGNYGKAFVIDEFGILKQNINKEEFLDHYMGYSMKNYGTKKAVDVLMPWSEKLHKRMKGCQNDTLCMKKCDENSVSAEEFPYTNFVIARLLPPYFVELEAREFDGERKRLRKS